MTTQTKKPFYKKWWFITFVVLVVIGSIGNALEGDKNENAEINTSVDPKESIDNEKEKLEKRKNEKEEQEQIKFEKAEEERLAKEKLEKEIAEKEEAERLEQEKIETEKAEEAEKLKQQEQTNADDEKDCNIKGSQSGIYHTPGSKHYERTQNVAQWFCSVEEAQQAGYRAPKR